MFRLPPFSRRSRPPHPTQQQQLVRWLAGALVLGGLAVISLIFMTSRTVSSRAQAHVQTIGSSSVPVPATPTPSQSERLHQVGADTSPVVNSTPGPQATPVPVPTFPTGDSRFAILLLGYGGGSHPGGYLTDSMIVAVVDPAKKTVTLLSLPRDSWVPMSFDNQTNVYNKINTAYAFAKDPGLFPNRLNRYTGDHGAGNFADDTVARLLGIPIRYYASLDFVGFRDMINALGGIDVNVPDGFSARYPVNDNPEINASWEIISFQPGLQHLDGERALQYARAREVINNPSESGDFARSRRQRLVIEAFKSRLIQPSGLVHLPQLLSIASQHVDTNYPLPQAAGLAQLALDWRDVKVYQTALTTDNYLEQGTGPDGTYLLTPSSSDHSWAAIQAFAKRLWSDPATGVAMASTPITIENDSQVSGVATRIGNQLSDLGYVVASSTTGQERSSSRIVVSSGAGVLVAKQLATDLGVNLPIVQKTTSSNATNTAIIQIGTDEADLSVDVPAASSAPLSVVGVEQFGVWPYYPPTPTTIPTPEQVATPTPEPAYPSSTTEVRSTPTSVPGMATPIRVQGNSSVVIVPNLVGMPLSEAQQVIRESDLMTTYVNYQTIDQVANHQFFLSTSPGAVISQIPNPGERVPPGTRVMLAVRKP